MRYYLLISIMIHTLAFLSIRQQLNQEQHKKREQKKEHALGNGLDNNIQIVEITGKTTKEAAKPRGYYWGLGISINENPMVISGMMYPVKIIKHAYQGYCGDYGGLIVGDVVYLINGDLIVGDNDFRGDGPRKMILTILRNGSTVRLQIDRCKIYY